MPDDNYPERTEDGKFPEGVSGNPLGRAKGSKNKVTALKLLLEESVRTESGSDIAEVCRLIINQAKNGDKASQKLVWDSVMSKGGFMDDNKSGQDKVQITVSVAEIPKAVTIENTEDAVDAEVTTTEEEKSDA